jgi:two-component system, oxyanion-binding sensor
LNTQQQLPPAEKDHLRVGYLRLTDSAPLIMAQELGFYQRYGLQVELCREASWANVRDKLVTGDLDAAQMLAPLPMATALGVGGMQADVITGLALSLNGNGITVSPSLASAIVDNGGRPGEDAASTAVALAEYIRSRPGEQPLTFAAAHTFSCHIFLLRHWLRAGGLNPERDVRIIVVPPEQMVDSLARGAIDGFCVGEPWNSVAVQDGVGAVQATGYDIFNNGMEKVLGVTEQWHQSFPGSHLRLRLALMEACNWLASTSNRIQAAAVLADKSYLDRAIAELLPSLSGQFVFSKDGPALDLPHFHVFGRFQAGFPWHSQGEWLLQEIGEMVGRDLSAEEVTLQVQRCFRTDLYREAASYLHMPCPSLDYRPTNAHRSVWEFEPGIELGPDMLL